MWPLTQCQVFKETHCNKTSGRSVSAEAVLIRDPILVDIPCSDITSRNLSHSKRNGASKSRAILALTRSFAIAATERRMSATPRRSTPLPTVISTCLYNTFQGTYFVLFN